jgi:hypothetical protein
MTIRERIINIVGGRQLANERTQMRESVNTLLNAYEQGKFRLTPDQLITQLSEYNANTVADLIRQRQGSVGYYYSDPEQSRIYQQQESRQQWLYSPLAQWAVNTWTSYGLGERVQVTCDDDDAQEIWDTVWHESAIFDDDAIHSLSDYVLVDGELYIAAFVSIADGTVKYEMLDADEMKEIITNPDNCNEPLYYKREYTAPDLTTRCIYYPDWHTYLYHEDDLEKASLPSDATVAVSEAMNQNNGTTVLVMHIAHNRKSAKSLHGWPILGIAAPYYSAHKSFLEDRLTVSHQKAAFTRELVTQGGSRAVTAVQGRFQSGLSSSSGYVDSNPPAGAGSTLVHNAAVEYKDLPMTTGAGDASTDNNMFAWMAGIGAGLFPTTMGLDTSRWATAVAMDKTQAVQWSRYQSFWACQFRKMVELVLMAAERWGNVTIEDKECTVSIDTLSLVDFPGVVGPISQMLNTIGSDATIPEQAKRAIIKKMWYPVLQALGADSIDEVLSDELLGILDEDERAALKAEQEQAKADMAAIRPTEPAAPAVPLVVPEPAAEAQYKYSLGMSNVLLEIARRKIAEMEKVKEENE